METCFLGIDGGGERSRLAIVDENLQPLARIEGGSIDINAGSGGKVFNTLSHLVTAGLEQAGVSVKSLKGGCVGCAGLTNPCEREVFRIYLARIIGEKTPVRLCNDGEILLCGALDALEGYCLIAGAGSLALGRARNGTLVRAGGLGFVLGDEGAAAWIGRMALARTLRSLEGRDPATGMLDALLEACGTECAEDLIVFAQRDRIKDRLAALAPLVMRAAERGDELALDILETAASELTGLVKSVIDRTPLIAEKTLVLAGGVLEHDSVVARLLRARLVWDCPDVRIMLPQKSALDGACLLARAEYEGGAGK